MRIVFDIDQPLEVCCGGHQFTARVDKPKMPPYPGTKIDLSFFWDKDADQLKGIHMEGSAAKILPGLREAVRQIELIDRECKRCYEKDGHKHHAKAHAAYMKRQRQKPRR